MNVAHGMRLDHPIFRGPIETTLEYATMDTPDGYRAHPAGKDLPEKMKTWQVQTGKFPDTLDVGLVSDPYGFEDSPDAEWISSGENTKGPRSVAIGRHGNFFLWGFSGDPTQMTEGARQVFLNAIHYMRSFDGLRPLVEKKSRSRDWAMVYVQYVRKYAGEKGRSDWLRGLFPEAVAGETGMDADKIEAYYKENLEYLVPDGRGFEADKQLKKLGVSNRDPAFFDKLLDRLTKDEEDEDAQLLWDRYLPADFETVDDIRAWVKENREFLFFSDVGGYRWFVDEHAKTGGRRQ